jgi:hypothetical protein
MKSILFQKFIGTGVLLAVSSLALTLIAAPQMERRDAEEYLAEQFANSTPTIGELAPNLNLKTMDGQDVSLADYRGRNIVIVKAGFT